MNVLQGSQHARVDQLIAYQVEGSLHLAVSAEQKSICELLQPIEDASHTRDRKRSPPDSACTRGTRLEVVQKLGAWTSSCILVEGEPHICWMHGYVGCGKSAISQEICRKTETEGRPLASFFFFRNAGDRSRIWRLATTLAAQMAGVVPETAPFVRAAADSTPGLKNFPVPVTSVAMQMQRLVYGPLKSAADHGPIGSLGGRPFLIVIDGLDECEDKDEVGELVDSMLTFFDENPFIPLRIFITSRVEQHIQSRLEAPGVRLDNLVDHCSDDDITAFIDVLFQDARRQNPVIKAYVRRRGEWPTPREKRKLVQHIGGSFIFASAVFKFIMGYNASKYDPTTPMDRLPLALKMNPGLDGLYAETLARSGHIPHFLNVISTIALLRVPLPISGIAELLGIHTYDVVNVLVDLQAIFQVPGTDDIPVTLCHTSLRDFLTTQSRSGRFFAHPRHHIRLYLRFLECEYELRRRRPGVTIDSSEITPAVAYYRRYSINHMDDGYGLFEGSESDSAIRLCRETLRLHPGSPELIDALADAIVAGNATAITSCTDLEEAISLYRESLLLRPSGDGGRWLSLYKLADALIVHHGSTRAMSDLEEAIDLCREALTLRPSPHPDCWILLINLGNAVRSRYRCTRIMADLEEAISLGRQALELRPSPHPDCALSLGILSIGLRERYLRTRSMADLDEGISLEREALNLRLSPHPYRSMSLHNLALSLQDRYQHTKSMADLEEAISLDREALELRPSPHPDRSTSLNNLAISLNDRYQHTKSIADLEEAISLDREALELRPSPHPVRSTSLNNLAISLNDRYQHTKSMADLEEAISLDREALELRPSPHPDRSTSLDTLAVFLEDRYQHTKSMADLEEAISLYREALELRPSPHPVRSMSLNNLAISLNDLYQRTKSMADLEEAISLGREALKLRPSPHPDRSTSLNTLVSFLKDGYQHTKSMADLEEAISLYREALELRPSPHPYRSISLNNLAISLNDRYQRTKSMADLEEAISLGREALKLRPSPHPDRSTSLNTLASFLKDRYHHTKSMADLEEAISLDREGLEFCPSPHPDRPDSLWELSVSLRDMYKATGSLPHLQESITHCEELLDSHHPVGHENRVVTLKRLASSLEMLSAATGQEGDRARSKALREEARRLSASTSDT